MIRLRVSRRDASSDEIGQALARLDDCAGAYFGCDAGIDGLHPLQAVLLDEPALSLRVFSDGLEVRAHSAFGASLAAMPDFARWELAARRRAGRHPFQSLRDLLGMFDGSTDVLLQGALAFDAHRLARQSTEDSSQSLGLLYFGERYWHRPAHGGWQRISLALADPHDAETWAAPAGVSQPCLTSAEPHDDFPPGGYARMVEQALEVLGRQELLSLTLSQSYRRRAAMSAAQAFARLRIVNPAPATFFLNDGRGECLFGASPDLQLVVQGRRIDSLPVCGTVARGPGPVGEAQSFRELINEEVDAASLAVCSDALRHDLAPLCEPGSLQLQQRRRQMSLATVVHTVDRFSGRLRDGVDAWDAIAATAAPVMVTGTPRLPALAAIARLEASARGWYGGLMVQVRADGNALVGTILRAAAMRDGIAEVRTGGDLMADSDPAREEQESRLKAVSLWRALGLEAPVEHGAGSQEDAAQRLPQQVALHDAGDAFPASVRDLLLGLGVAVREGEDVAVLVGSDATACARILAARGQRRLVALGDAALRVLEHAGYQVAPIKPEHGRLQTLHATAAAPWVDRRPFVAARYASLALLDTQVLPGWDVWAHDEHGRPMVLVRARDHTACLLFRPDSLLSGVPAQQALCAALAWATVPEATRA